MQENQEKSYLNEFKNIIYRANPITIESLEILDFLEKKIIKEIDIEKTKIYKTMIILEKFFTENNGIEKKRSIFLDSIGLAGGILSSIGTGVGGFPGFLPLCMAGSGIDFTSTAYKSGLDVKNNITDDQLSALLGEKLKKGLEKSTAQFSKKLNLTNSLFNLSLSIGSIATLIFAMENSNKEEKDEYQNYSYAYLSLCAFKSLKTGVELLFLKNIKKEIDIDQLSGLMTEKAFETFKKISKEISRFQFEDNNSISKILKEERYQEGKILEALNNIILYQYGIDILEINTKREKNNVINQMLEKERQKEIYNNLEDMDIKIRKIRTPKKNLYKY